jgi:hypothetical protein
MNEEINQAIQLRLEQARETLKEADALREHELWRGVINRSYYAMFYAVLALGVYKQIVLSKHFRRLLSLTKNLLKLGFFPASFRAPCIWGSISARSMITATSGRRVKLRQRLFSPKLACLWKALMVI